MGKIIYHVGDIFEAMRKGKHQFMAHGCNCQNAMGSGIAPFVRKECPEAYEADQGTKRGDIKKLGTMTSGMVSYEGVPFSSVYLNWYTQFDYSHWVNHEPLSYDAVNTCAKIFGQVARNQRMAEHGFCMPLIGAGLAGGDWNIISLMIKNRIDVSHVYVLPNDDDLSKVFGEDFHNVVFPVKTEGGKYMLGQISKDNVITTLAGFTATSIEDVLESKVQIGNRKLLDVEVWL